MAYLETGLVAIKLIAPVSSCQYLSSSSSVPVNSFRVVVSSLPGRRCAGVRRSLVADIGTYDTSDSPDPHDILLIKLLVGEFDIYMCLYSALCVCCVATLRKAGVQDVFVLCTETELRR